MTKPNLCIVTGIFVVRSNPSLAAERCKTVSFFIPLDVAVTWYPHEGDIIFAFVQELLDLLDERMLIARGLQSVTLAQSDTKNECRKTSVSNGSRYS